MASAGFLGRYWYICDSPISADISANRRIGRALIISAEMYKRHNRLWPYDSYTNVLLLITCSVLLACGLPVVCTNELQWAAPTFPLCTDRLTGRFPPSSRWTEAPPQHTVCHSNSWRHTHPRARHRGTSCQLTHTHTHTVLKAPSSTHLKLSHFYWEHLKHRFKIIGETSVWLHAVTLQYTTLRHMATMCLHVCTYLYINRNGWRKDKSYKGFIVCELLRWSGKLPLVTGVGSRPEAGRGSAGRVGRTGSTVLL